MIRFFFEYNNTVIQLPVNPPSLRVRKQGKNESESMINLGEVTIIREAKLAEIEIKCFLPATVSGPYVITTGQFEPPMYYIDFFNNVLIDKKPVQLIVTDCYINIPVTIESFEYERSAGTDDIEYTLLLKRYRPFTAKQIVVATNITTGLQEVQSQTSSRVVTKVVDKKYKVKTGDTLWKIAKSQLGDGNKYLAIYNKNKKIIGLNPNTIKVGQVLNLEGV